MNGTVSFDGQTKAEGSGRKTSTPGRVRLRPVALPVEHGGWSLTLEPIALGLLVAPSAAGIFLSIATLGAFLARHPFKIVAADRRRGRRFPRTAVALKFLLLYGGIAAAAGLAALLTAESYAFLLPLAAAVPLASVQLFYDAKGQSRALLPELAGSFGLAAVAAGIAAAGGWTLAAALVLWAVMTGRVVPSILYVHARLARLHGETPSTLPTLVTHAAALVFVAVLAWRGATPGLAVAAFAVLLVRAFAGLSAKKGGGSAMRVGVAEIGYGVLTVLSVAVGYRLG